MTERERVSVIGLGRLGAPMAACLAARGFRVIGCDPVPEKVEALVERRPLTHEPHFDEVLRRAGDNLTGTTDIREAVRGTDLTLVVVPTPSAPDGSFALDHVLQTCTKIGEALKEKDGYHVVSLTSTMMPGATQRHARSMLERASERRVGEDFGLCYSPLFVTMGNVVREFLNPNFVLVGEWDERSGDAMSAVWNGLVENDPALVRMSLANAELTKLAVNVFVTTKISFANMLARLCEQMPGGHVDVVTQAMELDERIGKGALCGAIAYGGPFFDHDNEALAALLRRLTVAPELVGVLGRFNRAQVPWLADLIQERAPAGGRIAVLGLSYKPDTDVIVNAIGIELCERLDERGFDLIAHDPVAMPEARGALPRSVDLAPTPEEAIRAADLAILTLPWDAYRTLPAEVWARSEASPRVVVDCWRVVPALSDQAGVDYVPLGIGPGVNVNERHPPLAERPCG